MGAGRTYHDLGRRVCSPSCRRPEDSNRMSHSVDPATARMRWNGPTTLAGLLLVALLISTAFAPASMFAPLRELAQPWGSPMLAPAGTSDTSTGGGGQAVDGQPSSGETTEQAVVNQSDPEPGIGLITAVYNTIEGRFFKPLDSRDLL